MEFRQLIDELESHPHNYVQTEYGALSEAVTHKVRCSELLGYLSAYVNYGTLTGTEPYRFAKIEEIAEKLSHHRALLGECFVPFFINRVIALHSTGRDAEVIQDVANLLTAILGRHAGDEGRGIPTPYYGIAQSVDWALGQGTQIKEDFQWHSYSLRPVLLLAVRYDLREVLNHHWQVLSRIAQQEMVPAEAKDHLMWRMKEGEQVDFFPDATQSWARLVADSIEDYSESLSPVLRRRQHFLPLFINVMPHRLNHRFVLTIFDARARHRDR